MNCQAISLHQPYASLIGTKTYETRHWRTNYRGILFICSAKKKTADYENYFNRFTCLHLDELHKPLGLYRNLPFGAVVAVVELVECHLMISMKFVLTVARLGQFKFLGLLLTVMPIRIIELIPQIEINCGLWEPGRYAWQLERIRLLTNPVPIVGRQSLWRPSPKIFNEVSKQFYDLETRSPISNRQSSPQLPAMHPR